MHKASSGLLDYHAWFYNHIGRFVKMDSITPGGPVQFFKESFAGLSQVQQQAVVQIFQ